MEVASYGALSSLNSSANCKRIIARTSSGSKRPNNPFQMMAMMPGAPEQLRKVGDCRVVQLAALGGAAQQRAQSRQELRQHLSVIKLGELREARPFADDQPNDVLAPRLVNFAHE